MSELAAFSTAAFWAYIQVFARVSALIVTAPVFGSAEVPVQVKVGLSFILTFALTPIVRASLGDVVPGTLYDTVVLLGGQVAIGLLIGFVVSLLFEGVRVGGGLLDLQMGFTQASVFNPLFNETVAPIANFQYRYAMVIYLLANGHWLLIAALERSFVGLPVAKLAFGPHSVGAYTDLTFAMLLAGVQIAAPAAAILLITDIGFAFLNRAMPQMQVYFVGMPVKVLIGLGVLIVVIPLFTAVVADMVTQSASNVFVALRGLHQ
jgi:flagellar biosynthetic protein FliR